MERSVPDELARRWAVVGQELIADTMTSFVHRVRLSDGTQAIVKLLKPAGLHERAGFHFLAWRGGAGAVRLIDSRDAGCMMEDAGTLSLGAFRRQRGEAEANAVIADVVRALGSAGPEPFPSQLVPLRRQFRALFEQAAGPDKSEHADLLRFCAAIADSLIATQDEMRPLHGDLHHENIVSGGPRGWLAIDPQGVFGDAAYEVANVFGNPHGIALDDPALILGRLRCFSAALGCSEEKILRFAIAQAGLAVSWSIEDGESLAPETQPCRRLAFIRIAASLLEAGTFTTA